MESYTIRMGLFDTRIWSAHDLVNLYKNELSKLGFTTNQLPSVIYPKLSPKVLFNEPFQGAKTISFELSPFGEFQQTRDENVSYNQDPAKLAEYGNALATIFTWNICSPEQMKEDSAGLLRDIFRRVKPEGILKLSPKVNKYLDAPVSLIGYPDKQTEPQCGTKKSSIKKAANIGLWSLLFGLGVSLLSKGKL